MQLEATITYNHHVAPVQRKDLSDYFPVANTHYPGYIKQAVFREKMKNALSFAQGNASAYVTQYNYGGSLLHQLRDENYDRMASEMKDSAYYTKFREYLLAAISQTDWRPSNLMGDMSKQLRQQAYASISAATVKPVAQLAAGKLIEKGVGKMASKIDTRIADNKINPKVGKALSWSLHTHEPLNKAAKEGEKHVTWMSINAGEIGFGVLADKGMDKVGGKVLPGTETFEASLNTEEMRGLLMKTGMSEGWANGIMGTVDFISDWVPVVAVTKMVESAAANAYLGYQYWQMADKAEESEKHFAEQWQRITEKLRVDLTTDINALSNEDLEGLCKLLSLEVKQ